MEAIDGIIFNQMMRAGALNLKKHAEEINNLNVFPIPDGDTGDNMLMTIMGGVEAAETEEENLGALARRVADGMLLNARGNSGVILSQFFDGIAAGFDGLERADERLLSDAVLKGVDHAYRSVMTPTEGTILTVARDAAEYATGQLESGGSFIESFVKEARESLARTPELLPVLKKAGVVDSGGAGLICIVEGMKSLMDNDEDAPNGQGREMKSGKAYSKPDFSKFTEDSVLEYGYCTELLLRLQRAKTDVESFDIQVIKDYLATIGDSLVIVKSGSIVKVHVHTMTPDRVLEFCRHYGEFLSVKIENMSLQHNSLEATEDNLKAVDSPDMFAKQETSKERKAYGVVAVASGDGLARTLLELGADGIVNGGQSNNPSAEDFINAFEKVDADTILVFPNNGNIIMAANQAAKMYTKADVRVIPSKNVGEGHAALCMLDVSSKNTDEIVENLKAAMEGVLTASVSVCVRDAKMDGFELKTGEYIGFMGKDIMSHGVDRLSAAKALVERMNYEDREICIIISGAGVDIKETEELKACIESRYPFCETHIIEGGQEIYNYILIAE